jgi:hypothetical protein
MFWKQLPLVDCQIWFGGGWVVLQLVQPFILGPIGGASGGSIIIMWKLSLDCRICVGG